MKRETKEHYDIFISYRREGGSPYASQLRTILLHEGYKVFMDTENLYAGQFEDKIFKYIDECTDFIVILSAGIV